MTTAVATATAYPASVRDPTDETGSSGLGAPVTAAPYGAGFPPGKVFRVKMTSN